MLLQLLLLWMLLLHLYGSGLWHREAGDLESEASQGFTEPAARDELAGGFFILGATGRMGCRFAKQVAGHGVPCPHQRAADDRQGGARS
jgi:hypothetical protein